ncbi:MAG: RagB/SusD family nutrient uptake outer membrane protein, partial [Chitinophagaceae bacterium]|nr:RagB/SusD family nutrient uptake outer membrane protein [Chitinophagaceae bacterium]
MKNGNYQYTILIILLVNVLITGSGCRKFVEIDTPPNKITQANVFSTDKTAITVLTGILVDIQGSCVNMAEYGGLLADEWMLWSNTDNNERKSFYTNALLSNENVSYGKDIWNVYYNIIFKCNSAIEGIKNNTLLTPVVQKQLLGEAYFIRAWLYFYLVNLWGDLPMPITTDPEVNRLLPRSTVAEVYNLITDDLLQAQELLTENYVDGRLMLYSAGSEERVRPNKWIATALLSRVYLYTGQWAKAETEAEKIIANTNLFELKPLNEIFKKNSQEVIWQLQPTSFGFNTLEARRFNLSAFPAGLSMEKQVYLSQFTLGAFENGDQRRIVWVDSLIEGSNIYYYPVKVKLAEFDPGVGSPAAMTEYSMMMR